MSQMAGRFTRVESGRRVGKSVLGLLSDLPRKNCRTIAEWAGDRTPDGVQASRTPEKADEARGLGARGFVVSATDGTLSHLGHLGPVTVDTVDLLIGRK